MARLEPFTAPLSINPLKVGQSVGAALAFLGLAECMPLQHGARGCTSFNKLFFMRHFREPIPLQTTAMELTTVVMGADTNVVEALKTIAERHHPAVIGLATTGLTATQGASLQLSLHRFRELYPEFADLAIVPVETCDSQGGLETGYALALQAILQALLPAEPATPRPRQLNVLVSPLMTPADVEALREWIEAYGLEPILLPDLGMSLDGSLGEGGYTPLTQGGTTRAAIARMHQSIATLVIGESLGGVADWLMARTGIPDFRLPGLHGLQQSDRLNQILSRLSGQPMPARQRRCRRQLLDAMLDCQFRLGVARVALAVEWDLLLALAPALTEVGCELVAAVIPAMPPQLSEDKLRALPCPRLAIGDLNRLQIQAGEGEAELLIGNSHAQLLADQLGIGLLPAGYPLHRHAGGHARQWIGYDGGRQLLYDLDNLLARHQRLLTPYRSRFWTERNTSSSISQGD